MSQFGGTNTNEAYGEFTVPDGQANGVDIQIADLSHSDPAVGVFDIIRAHTDSPSRPATTINVAILQKPGIDDAFIDVDIFP